MALVEVGADLRREVRRVRAREGRAGRVAGGIFRPGDAVTVLPSGLISKIKSIDTFEGPVGEAFAPMSVSITLEDDIDIGCSSRRIARSPGCVWCRR